MWIDQKAAKWCHTCGVPSISQSTHCDCCGELLTDLTLKYPHWSTETRPIFPPEADFLRSLITREFGGEFAQTAMPEDMLCFFNVNSRGGNSGRILRNGNYLFEVSFSEKLDDWVLKPFIHALEYGLPARGYLQIRSAYHIDLLHSPRVLAGWIETSPKELVPDRFVFLSSHPIWAVGRILRTVDNERPNAPVIDIVERGCHIPKTRPHHALGSLESQIETLLRANSTPLKELVETAKDLLRKRAKASKLDVAVSFSGGKDSTVILLLTYEALSRNRFKVIFIDTGIEFPETISYVEQTISALSLDDSFICAKAERDFFDLWEYFGPPTSARRWCCKTQKFSPMNAVIKHEFPMGLLTIAGVRSQESMTRRWSNTSEHNKWIDKQELLYLIKDWSLLEVWLFILDMEEKLKQRGIKMPRNALYEKGLTRVGCWACPMISRASFRIQERIAGNLMDNLKSKLEPYILKLGGEQDWIGIMHSKEDLTLNVGERMTPCLDDTQIVLRSVPNGGRLAEFLKICGPFERSSLGSFYWPVEVSGNRITLTNSNSLSMPRTLLEGRLQRLILKGIACVGCGLCIDSCPHGCLSLDNGCLVVSADCIHCGVCVDFHCPALDKYHTVSLEGTI